MKGVVRQCERNGRCLVQTEIGNFVVEFDEGPQRTNTVISGLRHDHGVQRLRREDDGETLDVYVNGLP